MLQEIYRSQLRDSSPPAFVRHPRLPTTASFVRKRPDGKYFRPCRPRGLCCRGKDIIMAASEATSRTGPSADEATGGCRGSVWAGNGVCLWSRNISPQIPDELQRQRCPCREEAWWTPPRPGDETLARSLTRDASCRQRQGTGPAKPPRKCPSSVGSWGRSRANRWWRFLQDHWDELF